MFVLSERLWLYVLPLIGMVITIFYLNSNVGVVALTICVFLVGYFAISLLFFLLMLILRTAVKKLGLLLSQAFSQDTQDFHKRPSTCNLLLYIPEYDTYHRVL